MRCLHCGKVLPLLKRLSGGEFCSDAHRREYQQEYSQLALSRLQQTHVSATPIPPPGTPHAPKTVSAAGPAAAETPKPAAAPTPTAAAKPPAAKPPIAPNLASAPMPPAALMPPAAPKPGTAPVPPSAPTPRVETQHGPAPVSPAARGAEPAPPPRKIPPVVPRPQLRRQAPLKQEAAAPTPMAGKLTRKPPMASMRVAARNAPKEQMFLAATAPNLPRREVPRVAAALGRASVVEWAPACDIRESAARAAEARVELRNFVRVAPLIDLGMIPRAPRTLDLASEAVDMPAVEGVPPGAAGLWQAPPSEFTGSAITLGVLADWQLSTIGFEDPRAGDQGVQARKEQFVPKEATEAIPLAVRAIAPAKARPVQVFAPSFPSRPTIQVPELEALPLRPTIVAAAAAEAVTPANGNTPEKPATETPVTERQALPRIEPAPPLNRVPAEPVTVSLALPVKQLDLGLPQLRLDTARRSIPSRIWKIIGGSAGVLMLVAGK